MFNPAIVFPAVDEGWAKTTADAAARGPPAGAIASLTRMLEGVPAGVDRATALLRQAADAGTAEGRPLFAGLRSLGFPGDPLGDLWRAADLVREHRGDSPHRRLGGAGVDAVEITLLTELWWGIGLNRYVPPGAGRPTRSTPASPGSSSGAWSTTTRSRPPEKPCVEASKTPPTRASAACSRPSTTTSDELFGRSGPGATPSWPPGATPPTPRPHPPLISGPDGPIDT